MNKIGRFIEAAAYTTSYSAGYVLLGIMILTLIEVVSRYILHQPLILCDEFGGYSLVVITCLGLAYCWQERGHIRIAFIVTRIPVKISNWLRIVTVSIALAYVCLVSIVSWEFLINSYQRGLKSSSWLMVPFWWPQMAIPIGFTFLSLILIADVANTARNIRTGESTEAIAELKGETPGEVSV